MDFLDLIRKVHQERRDTWIAKHYGPGPHPSGSPQSVHGGKGGKGKGALLSSSATEKYKKAWQGRVNQGSSTRSLEAEIRREGYKAYFKRYGKKKEGAKAAVDKLMAQIKGKAREGKRLDSVTELGIEITQLRDKKYKLELDLLRTRYKPKYRRQRQAKVDELQRQIDDLMERKREVARRKGYKYS